MFKNPITLSIALALSAASLGMAAAPAQGADTTATSVKTMNPFFQQSPLPLQYPQFDKITDADFAPAFERGMADNSREIEAIANSKDKPTFANTILAMESSGQLLRRALTVFFNLASANTNDTLDKLDAEYSPKLAAHNDSVYLNAKLFERIKALYDKRETLGLDAQGVRLIERYHTDFVRADGTLTEA